MQQVRLEELAKKHLRPGVSVWARRGDSSAAIVRPACQAPGSGYSYDLVVEVPAGVEDPVRMVRAALIHLGLGVVLH